LSSLLQCQFHGQISFARDIAALHVAARHASNMTAIDEFAQKHHIDIHKMKAELTAVAAARLAAAKAVLAAASTP